MKNTKIWENNVYVFNHLKAHLGEYKLIVLFSNHMGVIEAIYKKLHDFRTSGTKFYNFQNSSKIIFDKSRLFDEF